MNYEILRDGLLVRVALSSFLVLGVVLLGMAQGPPPRPEGDPLRPLKQALEDAGASQLSSDQEVQLKALIKSFHDSLPKPGPPGPGPDDAMRAAHRAYDQAILAGDVAAAQAQATAIANQMAAIGSAQLRAEASFQIQVLNILKAGGNQLPALLQRFGSAGLPGLLRSPLGGPGFGPPHGPGGPGGNPGQRPPGPPPGR